MRSEEIGINMTALSNCCRSSYMNILNWLDRDGNRLRINLAKTRCSRGSEQTQQEEEKKHHRWAICDWQDKSQKARADENKQDTVNLILNWKCYTSHVSHTS